MEHLEIWDEFRALRALIRQQGDWIARLKARIKELEAYKDGMAEAANQIAAESSPHVEYHVGPGTYEYEVDDFMDTRLERPR